MTPTPPYPHTPSPYFQNEYAIIYHGDNREILPSLPDNTAIATVTDPPYEVNLNPDICPWDKWPQDWSEIYRTSAEYLTLTLAPRIAHARIPDVLRDGWDVLEVGVWIYGDGRPVRKDRLKRSYDFVYYLSKSSRSLFTENGRGHYRANSMTGRKGRIIRKTTALGRTFSNIASGAVYETGKVDYHPSDVTCEVGCDAFGDSRYEMIFAVKRMRSSKDGDERHPTEKPLAMVAQQIKLVSYPGDVILDPFMGSGTTLQAAGNLGRQAIGIEQNEAYCELAAKRLEEPLLDYGNDRHKRLVQGVLDFEETGN
jgi:site-specific DNA-methyltransferase (adenine-specific)